MRTQYMTLKEASQFLRISLSKIYKMTSVKGIPHYKVGGKILFKPQELIDFVEGGGPSAKSSDIDGFDLIGPFQEAA
jgi:excisionase family DNA binding protein